MLLTVRPCGGQVSLEGLPQARITR